MPLSRRLLSSLLWALHLMDWWVEVAALILAVVAAVRLAQANLTGSALWGGVALALYLVGQYTKANGYLLFVADETVGGYGGSYADFCRGLAAGRFLRRHYTGLLFWANISGEPVQVRWLPERRPPCLAVIQPAELPESTFSPIEAAERFVLWYPGSTVRVGWVAVGWAVHPGIELRFIGKRLVLTLPTAELARALAEALSQAA